MGTIANISVSGNTCILRFGRVDVTNTFTWNGNHYLTGSSSMNSKLNLNGSTTILGGMLISGIQVSNFGVFQFEGIGIYMNSSNYVVEFTNERGS